MIRFSWAQASKSTIKRYFRKAGYLISSDIETHREISIHKDDPRWENFNSEATFKECIKLDNAFTICRPLNKTL